MKTIYYGAAALMLLCVPAGAQDSKMPAQNVQTLDPIELSIHANKPPVTLDAERRRAIQNAMVTIHTQQKTPPGFKPQEGAGLPARMKVDAFPSPLNRQQPQLQQYGYAKTRDDIVVVDPMNRKIVAVVPRKFPATGNEPTAADWAGTRGRALLGHLPDPPTEAQRHHDPTVGDGDTESGGELK